MASSAAPRTRRTGGPGASASTLARTLSRFHALVATGSYYEAHQLARTIASRHLKDKRISDAVQLLYAASKSLLERHSGNSDVDGKYAASGVDLAMMLVDAMSTAGVCVDAESLGRVVDLIALVPTREAQRRLFLVKSMRWTEVCGEVKTGSPQLHHLIGLLYWKDEKYGDAERHFFLGTRESARMWARMLFSAYVRNEDASALSKNKEGFSAGKMIARPVLQYLSRGDHRGATVAFETFAALLRDHDRSGERSHAEATLKHFRDPAHALALATCLAGTDSNEDSDTEKRTPLTDHSVPVDVYRDRWMNMCRLVIETTARDARDVFVIVRDAYRAELASDAALSRAMDAAGAAYFGVQRSSGGPAGNQAQALQAMMAAVFGGAPQL